MMVETIEVWAGVTTMAVSGEVGCGVAGSRVAVSMDSCDGSGGSAFGYGQDGQDGGNGRSGRKHKR